MLLSVGEEAAPELRMHEYYDWIQERRPGAPKRIWGAMLTPVFRREHAKFHEVFCMAKSADLRGHGTLVEQDRPT